MITSVGDVGDEREMPCPLDSDGELPLMTGTGAGNSARKYLGAFGKVLSDAADIFVVDIIDLVGAERAYFLPSLVAEGRFGIIGMIAGFDDVVRERILCNELS